MSGVDLYWLRLGAGDNAHCVRGARARSRPGLRVKDAVRRFAVGFADP